MVVYTLSNSASARFPPTPEEALPQSLRRARRTAILPSLTIVVLVISGLAAPWHDYPIVIGHLAFNIWRFREYAVALCVTIVLAWLVRHVFVAIIRADETAQSPAGRRLGTSLVFAIIAAALAVYAALMRLDLYSGDEYIALMAAPRLAADAVPSFSQIWPLLFTPKGMNYVGTFNNLGGSYKPLSMLLAAFVIHVSPILLPVYSILLHAINAVLIAWVASIFYPSQRGIPLLAGILVVLRPEVVETVVRPDCQSYLLSVCLALLAVISFNRGVMRRSVRWIACSCVCYFLAVLSQEAAVVVPILLGMCLPFWIRKEAGVRKFAVGSLLAQLAVLGAYLALYFVMSIYFARYGNNMRWSLIWPVKIKQVLLALIYKPYWTFLFPFDDSMPSLRVLALWIAPVLTLPLVAMVWLRSWRDRGFCVGVAAAGIAMLPTANFFDMEFNWGNGRHGYFAFLLLCIPYASVLVAVWSRQYSSRALNVAMRTAVVMVCLAIGSVTFEMERLFVSVGSFAPRIATAADRDLTRPIDRRPRFLQPSQFITGLGPEFCRLTGPRLRHIVSDIMSLDTNVDAGCEAILPLSIPGSAMPTVKYEWESVNYFIDHPATPNRQHRIAYWDDARSRLVDATGLVPGAALESRGRPSALPLPLAIVHGLSAEADGSLMQRGRVGILRAFPVGISPRRDDEIDFHMRIEPLGGVSVGGVGVRFLTIRWTGELPEGFDGQLRIPIIADGVDRRYLVKVGTSVMWLLARRVDALQFELPDFPMRVAVGALQINHTGETTPATGL